MDDITTKIIGITRIIGRKHFHVKYISISYRIRGKHPRIRTNMAAINVVLIINMMFKWSGVCKRIVDVIILINRMFMYSAIKIKANVLLLYSVLNPDTSSDSPSAKSNGVRFVSARDEMNHIAISGMNRIIIDDFWSIIIFVNSIELMQMIVVNIISDILTSYEIVWATPRSLPRSEYFEFEYHPAMNVAYTFILEMHRKKIAPNGRNIDWCLCGNSIHRAIARDNLRIGANMNGTLFAFVGLFCSFANSLMASANGCGRPDSIGLFGPFRS